MYVLYYIKCVHLATLMEIEYRLDICRVDVGRCDVFLEGEVFIEVHNAGCETFALANKSQSPVLDSRV